MDFFSHKFVTVCIDIINSIEIHLGFFFALQNSNSFKIWNISNDFVISSIVGIDDDRHVWFALDTKIRDQSYRFCWAQTVKLLVKNCCFVHLFRTNKHFTKIDGWYQVFAYRRNCYHHWQWSNKLWAPSTLLCGISCVPLDMYVLIIIVISVGSISRQLSGGCHCSNEEGQTNKFGHANKRMEYSSISKMEQRVISSAWTNWLVNRVLAFFFRLMFMSIPNEKRIITWMIDLFWPYT